MTKSPKPITTRRVQATLRQIGFAASKNQGASRIRGLPNISPGYTVKDYGSSIRISWVSGSDRTVLREQVLLNVRELGEALIGAGFDCTLDGVEVVIRKGVPNR